MGNKVPQMVSGLGMAMRLISSLIDEVKRQGGHEEMLHCLTTNFGRQHIAKIAELILTLPWRVPKSVIVRITRERSLEEYGDGYAISDEHFFWHLAFEQLGIPYIRFAPKDEFDDEFFDIEELREQIDGKTIVAGAPIRWRDDEYFFAGLGNKNDDPMPGDTINIDELESVHLVAVQYVDLDR